MDLYTVTFAVLALSSGLLAYRQHRDDDALRQPKDDAAEAQSVDLQSIATRFKRVFLPVYCLIMGSDWLQGPYIYTLYKDEKGLAESVVAALFTTGFVSAAISATFAGALADKYGRRLACLVFCGTYVVSCLTVLSEDLVVLFLGRVLGGISTTLMYSVFESWMVTEYYVQNLDKSTLSLSSMFGLMTTLNSGTAILSGVIGESIVSYTETKTSPFMASIVCLALAAWAMQTYWSENHGDSASQSSTTEKSGFAIILADRRILVLGLISTAFEGTMYLFVFFWSAAMKSVHARALIAASDFVTSASILPFGLIFATFMASMMLGSLGFSAASSYASKSTVQFVSGVKSIFSSASMLVFAIGTASSALLLTVLIKDEKITFWLFCLFEACIGIYFPSMAYQKGRIVDDGVRAKVYGILRIPLNCFVVAALSLTKEGDAHRDRVFTFCGGILLVASIAGGYYLEDIKEERHVEWSDEERFE